MYTKLIDNNRKTLKDQLIEIIDSGQYKDLSIATGYWDLPGMQDILDKLEGFESIRLLIGQEPLPNRLISKLSDIKQDNKDELFPDENFSYDLEKLASQTSESTDAASLRNVAVRLVKLIEDGTMEVKVFRHPRLHAKAYIFGNEESESAVGIVGSSNFTRAGLTSNAELNYLEENHTQVLFKPTNESQGHGHLSWFNELWNDEEAVEWSGDFTSVVELSPLGDKTYGPYDVYIRTLMEVYPDELLPPQELSTETQDILFAFQNRNAGILINKLRKHGVAMLSDSVGLGKTITAGAVIKHFRETGAKRVMVITPASLMNQWKEDLGDKLHISHLDYEIVSMQNITKHKEILEDLQKSHIREVDLFVIDEAHNLRSANSSRYASILEILESCLDAPVLLLTATPVNNKLIDLANQIQLAMRGSMESVLVQYPDSSGNLKVADFFNALRIIQSEQTKAEKAGEAFDWSKYQTTLKTGISHYLVRSTRQGVEAEGSLIRGGVAKKFPRTRVHQLSYKYDETFVSQIFKEVENSVTSNFEGINPFLLNIDIASKVTLQTTHPMELYKPIDELASKPKQLDMLDDEDYAQLFLETQEQALIPGIFQIINFLGFAPYRPDVYRHKYYAKTSEEIWALSLSSSEQGKIRTQRCIHNMLHTTWLKRLESSAYSLLRSVEFYEVRLGLFKKYLEKGYVVSLSDIEGVDEEYGDDIERAFEDFDRTSKAIQDALDKGIDTAQERLAGIERVEASEKEFALEALINDIHRDEKVIEVLKRILSLMEKPENNGKLIAFSEELKKLINSESYGSKVLVFSFFADTVEYLKNSLSPLLEDVPNFDNRCGFISGANSSDSNQIAGRFAPKGKVYKFKEGEQELDFLFATDVLSEGQNLQDAGVLINYDLHWNPVRMIQRNGRINRLGSEFEEVQVLNMTPHDDLEAYLNLVRKLERKIETIKNSVGTDQSVLGEEENPIEFIDFFSRDEKIASKAAEDAEENAQNIGVFAGEDEYQFELRKYLENHKDDEDRRRVETIPLGKWNYLPDKDTGNNAHSAQPHLKPLKNNEFIALEKVEGHGAVTGEEFTTTLFMKATAEGRYYRADPIDEIEALARIKADPTDNEPRRDRINGEVDRLKVARRANDIARIKAEATGVLNQLKPRELDAIRIMQEHYPQEVDIRGIVEREIRFEQDNREFKKIVKMINTEVKENGVVQASTVTRFEKLINKLRSIASEEQQADRIIDVLFYAQA